MTTRARQTTDVLIVGAGPTGLMAANVLARAGVDFRIVDKKAGPTEESRALWVQPRTVEYMDKLGLSARALSEGQMMTDIHLLVNGRHAGKIAFGSEGEHRTPYPFGLVLEQSESERLLAGGLDSAGRRVEWGTGLASLEETQDGASAVLDRPDGSQDTVEAAWVIGADGARSAVRESLGLTLEGETYDNGFFLADVDLQWEKGHEDLYLDLTDDGFLAFFPMRGESRFRVIGSLTSDLKARHDADEKVGLEDIRPVVEGSSGVELRLTGSRWVTTYRIHQRMADRFRSGAVGRIFLAGDAAHIHSPAGGQGMNTGIADAYNLGWKLAAVVKGEAKPALLDSYEAERMPVARSVLNVTDKMFALEVTSNPLLKRFRTLLMPAILNLTTRLRLASGLFFGIISQVGVNYRGSPVVADGGGFDRKAPEPGDRAPYGRFRDGAGLYERLRGGDHHLLVFEETGEAAPGYSLSALAARLGRYRTPIEIHALRAEDRELHELYGINSPSLFLVRPDGHLAYRGPLQDTSGLERYLAGLFEAEPSGAPAPGQHREQEAAAGTVSVQRRPRTTSRGGAE